MCKATAILQRAQRQKEGVKMVVGSFRQRRTLTLSLSHTHTHTPTDTLSGLSSHTPHTHHTHTTHSPHTHIRHTHSYTRTHICIYATRTRTHAHTRTHTLDTCPRAKEVRDATGRRAAHPRLAGWLTVHPSADLRSPQRGLTVSVVAECWRTPWPSLLWVVRVATARRMCASSR